MLERESKPRSGTESYREAAERVVLAFGRMERKDLDHLTGKQLQELMFGAKTTMAAMETQMLIRIRQSHDNNGGD